MKPDIFSSAQNLFRRVNNSLFKIDPNADAEQAAKARRRRVVMLFGGVIFAAALGVYALSHSGGNEKAANVDRTQAVTAVTLEERPFNQRVALQGEARPRRDYQVYAPASGVRMWDPLESTCRHASLSIL